MEAIKKVMEMKNDNIADDHARIGDILIALEKLNQQDVDRILARQREKNILFGEAAKQLALISESDIEQVLSQQFSYSYIHKASASEKIQLLSKALVAAHSPFSEEVENLRSLRSQLLIRWFGLRNKTLAITSANTNDGASLVAANLAIVFSQLNKNTLLIDANLRQATQHHLFGIETKLGLSNILANRQGRYQLSRQESLPNLTILTAGTDVPNPQELLSKTGFSELLIDLEKIYDIILIDTSPLNLGSDVLTVVSKAKAAIIVAKKDFTMAGEIQDLNQQLHMTGANILGSVLQEI
jgi:protein-tyrosine kinase